MQSRPLQGLFSLPPGRATGGILAPSLTCPNSAHRRGLLVPTGSDHCLGRPHIRTPVSFPSWARVPVPSPGPLPLVPAVTTDLPDLLLSVPPGSGAQVRSGLLDSGRNVLPAQPSLPVPLCPHTQRPGGLLPLSSWLGMRSAPPPLLGATDSPGPCWGFPSETRSPQQAARRAGHRRPTLAPQTETAPHCMPGWVGTEAWAPRQTRAALPIRLVSRAGGASADRVVDRHVALLVWTAPCLEDQWSPHPGL